MAGEGQKALGDVGNTEDEKRSADDGRQGRVNSKAVSQLSHHVQLPRRPDIYAVFPARLPSPAATVQLGRVSVLIMILMPHHHH